MGNALKIYETNEKQLQHWKTDAVERQGMGFIERDTEKWDLRFVGIEVVIDSTVWHYLEANLRNDVVWEEIRSVVV